jgi:DNA mismatch endonuclease (patch repair protein)
MKVKPPTPARSRIMTAIRGKGNHSTEVAFARVLRSERVSGWRRHLELPGRPDFSWPSLRIAVFVDGCFWHGCPRCYEAPRRNSAFWKDKIFANRSRDRRVSAKLRREGWIVIRIWECRVQSLGSLRRVQSALVNRLSVARK